MDAAGQLLVGQRDGTISLVSASGEKSDVMKSHSDGEVWGLVVGPSGKLGTSADDNKVMFWDPDTRSCVKTVKVSDRTDKSRRGKASTLSRKPEAQCSRALAINNEFVAVAANDGSVSIRTTSDSGTEIKLFRDSGEWIEVMAFSPDNQYLAVGSHDNNIYVYRTADWSL
jgi:WD40 repeat protein